MRPRTPSRAERGFSLVEVMIALIIIAVGMLGIAKLEAVVLSSAGTSRVRALVSLQAASLADSIHADRDFWSGLSGDWASPLSVTVTESSSASPTLAAGNSASLSAALGSPPDCTAGACSPVNLAGYDLNQWATALSSVLPDSTSSVDCISANTVPTCTITIQWNENTIAANQQEAKAGSPTAFQKQTYTLVVEP